MAVKKLEEHTWKRIDKYITIISTLRVNRFFSLSQNAKIKNQKSISVPLIFEHCGTKSFSPSKVIIDRGMNWRRYNLYLDLK